MTLRLFILLSLASSFFMNTVAHGQESLAIGQWDQLLPFVDATAVTGYGETVYYGNNSGICKINPDESLEYFTTVDGLSDVGITALAFSEQLDVLIVGYNSGLIDFIYPNEIITINDIAINENIITGKTINDLLVVDDVVYVSTGFGFSILNIETGLFPVTLNTSFPVYQSTVFEEEIYIASDNGVYKYNTTNGNQADLNNWELLNDELNITGSYSSKGVSQFDGAVFIDAEDALYRYDGVGAARIIDQENQYTTRYIYAGPTHLFYSRLCSSGTGQDNCQSQVFSIDMRGDIKPAGFDCSARNTCVYQSPSGLSWYGDRFNFYRKAELTGSGCFDIIPNTPRTPKVHDIELFDSLLWVTAGGTNDALTPRTTIEGSYFLADGQWDFVTQKNYDVLEENDVRDHYEVERHPDGRIFITSASDGLIELDLATQAMVLWDRTNSDIQPAQGDSNRDRVLGVQIDSRGDVWITNFLSPDPIVVYRLNGEWDKFDPVSSIFLHTMVIDDNDYLWIADASTTNGLVIYDTQSGRVRSVRESDEGLPSNDIISIAKDLDGAIWVGTDRGVAVFNCGNDPIEDSDCGGIRPRISQDGFLAFLLRDQISKTIAVDAANRKWIGTNNGIFVVSEDGTEQIEQYTTSNSPLISDEIIDIEIDNKTGQVYIATQGGIMTIRGAAIEGGDRHDFRAVAYPNPVPSDYNGPIAIRGLASESAVKITDVQGRLVFETRSLGGQAVWDGTDFSGREVASGIYYVLASTTRGFDGADGIVAEIAIIR